MNLEREQKITPKKKEFLTAVFRDIFNACFTPKIEDCETYNDFRVLMFQQADNIGDYLDLELADDDEIRYKDNEIADLEQDVIDLQLKLSKYENDSSLIDEWKAEIIQEHLHKYSPQELQQRLSS